ncbi:MAG: ArsR family transcriptional regulator [Clostridiales bacterium]|nr:ArsR family transcriptional regulator [Clostridiales bacterium]
MEGIMPLDKAIWELEKQLLSNSKEKYKSTREIAKALGVNQSTVSRKLGKMKREQEPGQ